MRAVKGIDDLLDAAERLLPTHPKLHLLLVGPIKDPDIQRRIDAFPDRSRIHCTGFREDAIRFARMADVVVMASKNREGFPKSIVEAMSQGVPAIVTAVGGMPELVGHGAAGVMVEPMNPQSIATAIDALYNDSALRNRLGKAGQERISTTFNIQETVTKMYTLFSELSSQVHQQQHARTNSSQTGCPQ